MHDRQQIQKAEYEFWQNEFRNVSFFTIKSSMGDTSKIRSPKDLYQLSFETEQKAIEHKPVIMTEDDFKFLKSFLKNQS